MEAKKLAENLNIEYDTIPIQDIVHTFENSLQHRFEGTERNVAEGDQCLRGRFRDSRYRSRDGRAPDRGCARQGFQG